jgi:hypothetical protein
MPGPEEFGLRGMKSPEIIREDDIRLCDHSGRKNGRIFWISSKGQGPCNLFRGRPSGEWIRHGCQQPDDLRAIGDKIPVNDLFQFVHNGSADDESEGAPLVEIKHFSG